VSPHAHGIREEFARLQRRSLAIAIVATIAVVAGALASPRDFFHAYLCSYLFWLGLSLGSLAIVMLHHMTGGSWGFAIRRLLEAGMRTLPLMALLFIPLVYGIKHLYPWADANNVAHDAQLQHKAPYLNVQFFLVRVAIYFALWIGFAWVNLRLSAKQDRTGDPGPERRARALSGPGLVAYAGTMTLASVDWAMSLEPHWFSTMYGLVFIVGQVLSTLSFSVVTAAWLTRREPFKRFLATSHFHDLGNLMFAFVMLWGYVNFSQFLIIWSGNVSEETPWYLHRIGSGWQTLALAMVVLHFFAPFFLLLVRKLKRNAQYLALIALLLLVTRYLDLYWLIAPAFHRAGFEIGWLDVVTPVAIGGWWLAAFISSLKGRPLISLQDAHLEGMLESTQHG
jgi:hypothetical protein